MIVKQNNLFMVYYLFINHLIELVLFMEIK